MPALNPKIRDELTLVEIDGEALVYDPETDGVHLLNPTASLVFQLTDGKATTSETACGIAQAFGAPLEDVEADVRGVMREFRRLRLLDDRSAIAPKPAARRRGRTKREQIRLDVPPSP